MKKKMCCLLAIGIFTITGCQSTQKQRVIYPPHYNTISVHEGLYCSAFAKVGAAGKGIAKNEASAKARDEMRRLINIKIKKVIINFAKTIGVEDEQTIDSIFTTVSMQAIESIGSLYSKKDYYDEANNANKFYVFMAFDDDMVTRMAESIKNTVSKIMKKETALWENFQAKNGQSELDKEVAKEFGGNKIVELCTFD